MAALQNGNALNCMWILNTEWSFGCHNSWKWTSLSENEHIPDYCFSYQILCPNTQSYNYNVFFPIIYLISIYLIYIYIVRIFVWKYYTSLTNVFTTTTYAPMTQLYYCMGDSLKKAIKTKPLIALVVNIKFGAVVWTVLVLTEIMRFLLHLIG